MNGLYFFDPDPKQVDGAKPQKQTIELYTEAYANGFPKSPEAAIAP